MTAAHNAYLHAIIARNNLMLYALAIPAVFAFTGITLNGRIKKIYIWSLVSLYYLSLVAFGLLWLIGLASG